MLRATLWKLKPVAAGIPNGEPKDRKVRYRDSSAISSATTGDELRQVRNILVSAPDVIRPTLFDRDNGNSLRLDAGTEFRSGSYPGFDRELSAGS